MNKATLINTLNNSDAFSLDKTTGYFYTVMKIDDVTRRLRIRIGRVSVRADIIGKTRGIKPTRLSGCLFDACKANTSTLVLGSVEIEV